MNSDSDHGDKLDDADSTESQAAADAAAALDLGLEQLLKEAEKELAAEIPGPEAKGVNSSAGLESSALLVEQGSETSEATAVIESPLAPLITLAAEERWAALADAADRLLSDPDIGTAASVYWCWAESRLKRLSASIVAAPLLSALEQCGRLPVETRAVLASAASEIALSLFKEQELSLSDAVLSQMRAQALAFSSERELRQLIASRRDDPSLESEVLERLRSIEDGLPKKSQTPSGSEPAPEVVEKAAPSVPVSEISSSGPSRRHMVAWIAVILLLIFATDYYRRRVTSEPEALVVAMLDPNIPVLSDSAVYFLPERIERFNSLDALLLELGTGSTNASPTLTSSPVASGSASPTRRPKEKVNTETPVEPPLSELTGGGRLSSHPPGQTTTGVTAGGDGSGSQLPQGSVGERVMWLLADTDVLERPSYAAPPVGSLRRGDRIRVDARVGDWLRLRNKDGKVGFILAQDASDQGPR